MYSVKQLIIITCLFSLTKAAPRNGYTYQSPVGQVPTIYASALPSVTSGIGYSSVGGGAPIPLPTLSNVAPPFSYSGAAVPSAQVYTPTSTSTVNQIGQNFGFIPSQRQPQQQFVQQRPAIITKDIYIHSAPEELETVDVGRQAAQLQGPLRKNYKIIFIKAPVHNAQYQAAALKAAQESTEEKTIIYVLTKKPDIQEIHEQLQTAPSSTKLHKPEVYFIKYKTQEEAQHAQQQIQAQYDKLGGPTRVTDEGFAPVTSVIGSLSGGVTQTVQTKVQNGQQSYDYSQSSGSFGTGTSTVELPSRNYLPAKLKK